MVRTLLVILAFLLCASVSAQTSVFTYQGHLSESGRSAAGYYDLVFTLWNSASGLAQIGPSLTNHAALVKDGVFTANLDFGSAPFDGSPLWLQVEVRTNGGTAFTTLSPRQPITSVPYAIHASTVPASGIKGAIPSTMLAPGAAAANLAATGNSPVPSGGVVFSGLEDDTNLINSGFIRSGGYIPALALWKRLPDAPLAPRAGHAAVWTGTNLLVWGGSSGYENPSMSPPRIRFTDGAKFDPENRVWTAITSAGAPSGRELFTYVWSGSEMLVWGGFFYDGSYNYLGDGARYQPLSNTWQPICTNQAPSPRARHTAVWTGREMLVWGGWVDYGGLQTTLFGDGGRYNPATGSWSPIQISGAPAARCDHIAVWTGTRMIVWGGRSGPGLTNRFDGATYDPLSDTWTEITSFAYEQGAVRAAVWTGTHMIKWGGFPSIGEPVYGGIYNPTTDAWSVLQRTFAPIVRSAATTVWTGKEMIIWGGENESNFNDGACFTPSSDTWTPITTTPLAPAPRYSHAAVWAGKEMLIFGGRDDYYWFNDLWSCTPPQTLYLYQRR